MFTADAPVFHPRPQPQRTRPAVPPLCFSLGIMAWNEERGLSRTLESLFQQSVFRELASRGQRCEIFCVANGCTDRTAEVARAVFRRMEFTHHYAATFTARVVDLPEPGRNNAWNRFVHEFSGRAAGYLYLMDADIILLHPDTIRNLFTTLENQPQAQVSSGRQHKDLEFKPRKSLGDLISLATSDMTGTIAGRFSGQLYCMRSTIARRLYLPRDLSATDDGFFKAAICTDFFSHAPDASKIVTAPDAAHLYEAYVRPRDVLNNQKRQMIGQTGVHVLVEFLKKRGATERADLAVFFEELESKDPDWLKKLIDRHLAPKKYFWQLFPGLLTFRFRRLWQMGGVRRITHLPAAVAGFGVTLIACARAFRFLKGGQTYYWPQAARSDESGSPSLARQ